VTLPDKLDPDDFLRNRGAEAFSALLNEARPLLEFLVLHTLRKHGSTPEGRERTLQELLPLLSEIKKESARDVTIRFLADLIGVRAEHIISLLKPARKAGSEEPSEGHQIGLMDRESRHQRRFLNILLRERQLIGKARELLQPGELSEPRLRKVFERMLQLSDEEFAQIEPEEMLDLYPDMAPDLRELLMDSSPVLQAIQKNEANLQYEIALIKEAQKEILFRKFKEAQGTEGEELSLRRYMKVRDELRILKSVPGARRLDQEPREGPVQPGVFQA